MIQCHSSLICILTESLWELSWSHCTVASILYASSDTSAADISNHTGFPSRSISGYSILVVWDIASV